MCAQYVWNIIPRETPRIEKNCTRCNSNLFVCSEKFRVNSNKKMIDVWLIYKCVNCENTWKMSILERKNLSQIDHNLFCQFQENNIHLAWKFAFDKSIAKANNARMLGNVLFDIAEEEDLLQSTEKIVSILIISKYELSIPVRKVIQKKFNLSANRALQLNNANIIVVNGDVNQDVSKKIGFKCQLLIDINALKC